MKTPSQAGSRVVLMAVVSSVVITLLLAALGVLAAVGLGWFSTGASSAGHEIAASDDWLGRGPATLLCELHQSVPVDGFDGPRRDTRVNLVGGIDLKARTGWYQGQYSLSETRKGLLRVEGPMLHVGRPALYERHGAMVSHEDFSLDRRTGEFVQTLSLQDGRQFELLKGYCGVIRKAPF